MIPYFYSSGHNLYAKCSHLYLQDMLKLKDTMMEAEYRKFIDGFFTIRRFDRRWSGIWTDMVIEQQLMRAIKITGGLIHGRGLTDSVISNWLLSMPTAVAISTELEKFTGLHFHYSEQHKDYRDSQHARDTQDGEKMEEWLKSHDPFPRHKAVYSIATGCAGKLEGKINCHLAYNVGKESMRKMTDTNYTTTIKRTEKTVTLASCLPTLKTDKETVCTDPLLLFQRICLIQHRSKIEDLKNNFCHELSPYPLSLFDDMGMRKGTKSKLHDFFPKLNSVDSSGPNHYVVDGGFLLHRVIWKPGQTFKSICKLYHK